MTTRQPRAALYLRLSDDKQQTGDNVADQKREGGKIAERLGATVVEVYDDNDRIASEPKRKPRPAFERMLADAEAGKFDLLIIRHADRLYRTTYDQGRIAEVFGPRKIVIHQEWAGYPLDLSTPTGVLTAGIMAQVAQYETDHKKERQRAMNRQRITSGKPPLGGPVPFGYSRHRDAEAGAVHLSVKEPEATMVREAHTALLTGASLRSIFKKWNESEVTAPRGGPWNYSTLRGVLTRPLNAGLVFYDGHVLPNVRGQWEPLVSEEEHYAVVALLDDPKRRTSPATGGVRRHLLPGIARCGSCGGGMKSGWVRSRPGHRHPIYRCTNPKCPRRVYIAMNPLEAEVERRFLEERGDLKVYRLISMTGHDAEALADVEARIKSVSARLAEDDADVAALVGRLTDLKAERARIKETPAVPQVESGTVREEWAKACALDANAALERKRELLLGHLAPGGLTIAPRGKVTHRFDPTRVDIEWQPVLVEEGPVEVTSDDPGDFGTVPTGSQKVSA